MRTFLCVGLMTGGDICRDDHMTGPMSYLLAVDTRNCKNNSGGKDFRATQTKRLRGDEVKIGHKADKIGHGRWGC